MTLFGALGVAFAFAVGLGKAASPRGANMAFGLEPLVRGRSWRDKAVIGLFVASMIATSALVGLALSTVGSPLAAELPLAPALLGVTLAALMVELGVSPFSAPYRHWQVPRDWPARYGLPGGYALWGATLGIGVLSYVPFASYHVLVVWMILSGSIEAGLLLGLGYGAGRALGSLVPAIVASRDVGRGMETASWALRNTSVNKGLQLALLFALCIGGLLAATG